MASSTHGSSGSSVAKRVVLGRAFSSDRLEHTLLPKVLALPVFASDALSSNAYATGEILLVLTIATANPQKYVMPIAVAVGLLLTIVIASYRQTVHVYDKGGGAYIVSKENLGRFPSLVAASALLFDYMMTVVVSIVAGVFAIGSAFTWANEHKVLLAIGFVIFVTVMNLRGTKESGVLFAIPTYGFVIALLTMIVVGFVSCLGGCPPVGVETEGLPDAATAAGAVGGFILLKAFSSGATALTGVEAIADGVPAFRRPQAHNAATTLAIMGAISVTLFLGISWLATHIDGVIASDERSVPAQIAIAVFGLDSIGFYAVQFFTAAILILAANTAYQDFPRLSSILARDRFMPSQLVNRGDRLVFSNGVILLGTLASLMIYIFDADLTAVIHLYVVGVFTAFTLSQSGMIRHWIAEGRKGEEAKPGWKRSIAINIVGAATTFVVLIVVTLSKFLDGAWLSILLMALMIPVMYSIHHHYEWVSSISRQGLETPGGIRRNHVVLLVRDLGPATAEALGYLKSFRPRDLHVVAAPGTLSEGLLDRWPAFAGSGIPAITMLGSGGLTSAVKAFVRTLPAGEGEFVTVVVPEIVGDRLLSYVLRRRDLIRLKASLLREQHVVVTDVPVALDGDGPAGVDGRPFVPNRTVTLVFVSSVNDITIRAVNYAIALEASETRAVHFKIDLETKNDLEERWIRSGIKIPLDVVEAPFRDLSIPMMEEVRRYTERADTVVNVIVPEFIVTKWWQLPLHNQTALFVKRLFLFEERVVLTSVPLVASEEEKARTAAPVVEPGRAPA